MHRKIGLILGGLLALEVVVAVVIVAAQPSGFGSLFNVSPLEKRQDIAGRTFETSGLAVRLDINNQTGGDIYVTGDPNATSVTVTGTKVVRFNDDNFFNRLHLDVNQNGNTLQIVGRRDEGFSGSSEVRVYVTAPARLVENLIARTGSADVRVSDLQNDAMRADISTGSGEIFVNRVKSAGAKLNVGSGDVRLTDFSGELVATSGSGEIIARGANELKAVQLKTGSGDIEIEGAFSLTAPGSIESGSGEIVVRPNSGNRPGFEVSTGSGDINSRLENATITSSSKKSLVVAGSPVLRIKTGSGDIALR
jgi:Putative adhesin